MASIGLAPHREELATARWRIGDAVEDERAVEQHARRAELHERQHVGSGLLRDERGGGTERGAAAGQPAEPDQAAVPPPGALGAVVDGDVEVGDDRRDGALDVAALLVDDLHVGADPLLERVEGWDAVVRRERRRPAAHDARLLGIRTDDRERRDRRPVDGQHPVVVLQEHHRFGRRLARERAVLGTVDRLRLRRLVVERAEPVEDRKEARDRGVDE